MAFSLGNGPNCGGETAETSMSSLQKLYSAPGLIANEGEEALNPMLFKSTYW